MRDAVSAGGVVYRRMDGGVEVVICHSVGRDIWALPKGTPERGESMLDTALREVQEETGLQVSEELELGAIDYWFVQDRHRVHKSVAFWLMAANGGSLDSHDREFDKVEWHPAAGALELLSYKGERDMVEAALVNLGENA